MRANSVGFLMKKTLILSATAFARNAAAWVYFLLLAPSTFANQDKAVVNIDEASSSSVYIYASRFEESVENALPQTVIISDREIQKSGLNNISEVLQKIGGLTVKKNLDGSTNGAIDIRGFGDSSDNNLLVLLDGIRLSENEQAAARTSLIPLEAIDHIEITKGGNSVLYGDGATGGTIHIITKTNLDDLTVATAGAGSYSQLQSSIFHARKSGDTNLTLFGRQVDSSGYREGSGVRERSIGMSAIHHLSGGNQLGIRATVSNERDKLPGSLPSAYLNKTPTASQVLGYDSTTRINTSSLSLIGRVQLRSDMQFLVDVNHSTKSNAWNWNYDASTIYDGYNPASHLGQSPYSVGNSNFFSHTNSFSPRIKFADVMVKGGSLIVGFDWREFKRSSASYKTDSDSYSFNDLGTTTNIYDGAIGSQSFGSKALYLRTSVPLNNQDSVVVGMRRQNYHQDSSSYFYSGGNTVGCQYCDASTYPFSGSGISSAYELQYNKNIFENLKFFVRNSRNFRFANLDDNASAASGNLRPQTSRDSEVGLVFENKSFKSSATYYSSRLTNEIGFNGSANVNFDPTKRQGLELVNRYQLSPRINLLGSLNLAESKFSSGKFSNKTVPGTSAVTGSAGVQYQLNPKERLGWQTRFSSYAYASSDMSNSQMHRAGYGESDLNYVYSEKQWQIMGSINNVLNKNYTDSAIYKSSYYPLYQLTAYPNPARNFSLTGRYSF